MALIPDTQAGKVQFFKSRLALWTANSTAIGSSSAQISALSALVTAAETAVTERATAQETAESKTAAADQAIAAMETLGATVISGVRYKARTAGDIVYQLSNIPAPAQRQPVSDLGTPRDFTVELEITGALTLKWKNANPASASGVVYQIWRRVTPAGAFTYLGGVGEKKYTDATIPAGSSQVTYQIQAVRSTAVGPWAQYNVNFGVGGTTTVTQGEPVKIAA